MEIQFYFEVRLLPLEEEGMHACERGEEIVKKMDIINNGSGARYYC